MVVWHLLFSFQQPTQCSMTMTPKKKVCYCCAFQSGSAEKQSSKSFLREGHKVSEIANLFGVSRTTVYEFEKRTDDGESVNRRAGSDRI